MKLLKWIIKMAKKLLNLDTTNGEQSWEDGSALPSGTVNKLLRHDGTEWIATVNSTLTDGNTNTEFKISNNANPTTRYSKTYISNTEAGFSMQIDNNKGTSMFSNTAYSQCMISNGTNEYIWSYADANQKSITLKPQNANEQTLSLTATRIYNAASKSIDLYGKFTVYQSGKIVSNYLSGSGIALLEATSDGTIQRSATAPTKTKIINRTLTSASSIHSFNNTDLGISGDLRDKIISFELLHKLSGFDFFSLGGLVQTEKTLTSGAVTFATGEIPIGDTIRLAITYTD